MLDSNPLRVKKSAEENPLLALRRGCAAAIAAFVVIAVATIEPVGLKAEENEVPAWNHTEVEQRVVELLAAGKQSEAEALLNEAVDHVPEAVEFAKLIGAGRAKQQEAMEFLQTHVDEIRKGQRLFFLLGAVTRSRFDIVPAMQIFGTTYAMDPNSPSAKCAVCVIKLDSAKIRAAGPEKANEVFQEVSKLADANPDDVVIRWMAAVECRSWNRNAEGAQHYKQILEKWNPGPSLVHQTYANLLDELQRYDEALVERNQTRSANMPSSSRPERMETPGGRGRFGAKSSKHKRSRKTRSKSIGRLCRSLQILPD